MQRPLTSQRLRPDRFALAWLDSGYMFCDSILAVWQNFASFLRVGGIRILRSMSCSPLAAGASEHRRCFSCLFALGNFAYFYEPVFARLWTVWSRSWRHATDQGNRVGDTACAVECRRCFSCGCGRPCDHAATSCLANSEGASDSIIAGVGGHSSSQQRRARCQRSMAAMNGFFLPFFRPFFSLLQVVWS